MAVTLHPDVAATETDDGMVLLDERSGRFFQLNRTGALILKTLLDGADIQQAAQLLSQRYAVALDRAVADVTALTDHLRDVGLVAGRASDAGRPRQ